MQQLNPNNVPENLRDLTALAEKWGIAADTARHRRAEMATDAELAEISVLLRGRHRQIEDWLYSFEPDDKVSTEAVAFQSLLVFEMEECEGPGIHGWLGYALLVWNETPTPEAEVRLRAAYENMKSATQKTGVRLYDDEFAEAEAILSRAR